MNFANVTSLTIPEGSVKAIYCNDVKLWGIAGTYENTITGVPPLTLANCTGDDLVSWSIVGNTIQDGTPSPENPVDVQGVGDWDDTEQKYKIPVKSNDTTTNIYLNSPLMQGETISSDGEREVEWGVLDLGSVSWYYAQAGVLASYPIWYTPQAIPRKSGAGNLFCTKLASASRGRDSMTSNHMVAPYNAVNNNQICVRYDEITTQAEFLSAMSGVKLYYQLYTPTTETFTPPSIPTQSGTTVIDTDCVVAPSEMTLTFMSTTPQNEETR